MSNLKKIIFFIVMFFIATFNVDASSQSNMIGSSSGTHTSHGGCVAHAPCNNGNFVAINVQLVHYSEKKYLKTIKSVVVYQNSGGESKNDWVHTYIDKNAQYWSELAGHRYDDPNFASDIRDIFLRSSIKKRLFDKKHFNLDYDDYVNKIAAGTEYADHQNIGDNGVNTTGYRIIVEPVYTYMGYCSGGGKCMYSATARQMAQKTFSSSPTQVLAKHIAPIANAIRFKVDDIGIHGADYISASNSKIHSIVGNKSNGYGRGEIAYFDNVYCNYKTDKKDHCCTRLKKTCGGLACYSSNKNLLERYYTSTQFKTRILEINMPYDAYEKYCDEGQDSGGGSSIKYYCNPNGSTTNHCCSAVNAAGGASCYVNGKMRERYYKKTKYDAKILTAELPYSDYKKYCLKCNPDKDKNYCCDKVNSSSIYDSSLYSGNNAILTRRITPTQYREHCQGTTEDACDYQLVVDLPNDCHTSNKDGRYAEATIGDGENSKKGNTWKCIFKSKDHSDYEVRNHFKPTPGDTNVNRYCQISCKQNIHFELPREGTRVEHGRYLVVEETDLHGSTIAPIRYDYNKTCRTSNPSGTEGIIDVDRFKSDIIYNNERKVNYYNNYIWYQHRIDACNSARYSYTVCETDEDGHEHCDSYYDDGYYPYEGGMYCSYWSSSGWGASYYYSNRDYYRSAYYDALDSQNSYLSQINKCSDFDASERVDYKLNMEYEEPVYGDEFNLNENKSYMSTDARYYTYGDSIKNDTGYGQYYKPTDSVRLNDCYGDNHCESTNNYYYGTAKWVEKQYSYTSTYKLDDYINRFVEKYSGMSYSGRDKSDDDNDIDIGVSNLPIHYSTKAGTYDFQVNFLKIGSGSRFYRYLYGTTEFNGKNYNIDGNHYDCDYRVTGNNVNPDVGPLVFREIPLTTKTNNSNTSLAFLTRNGSTRTPGTNWNDSSKISKYIINNRGVKGNKVYNLPPLYDITLTPNLMKEIKSYNHDMNNQLVSIYDGTDKEKYGVVGYTNTGELDCVKSGANCISTVMRDSWGVSGCVIKGNCPDKCNNDNSCS